MGDVDEDRLTDGAVRLALDAAFPGLPGDMTMEEAERRVRAAIVAYLRALTTPDRSVCPSCWGRMRARLGRFGWCCMSCRRVVLWRVRTDDRAR